MTVTDKQLIERATADHAGCWISGANWGRHSSTRLVQTALINGWTLTDEDQEIFDRLWVESQWRGEPARDDDWSALIDQGGIADDAEAWMNEHLAPEGYVFGWNDGDFVLWPEHAWCEEFGMCDHEPEEIVMAARYTG